MSPEKRKVPFVARGDELFVVQGQDGSCRIAQKVEEFTFAHELRNAARVMVNSAKATEVGPDTNLQLKAFVHGAIILSYGALEAALNEIIHLHALTAESPLDEAERKVIYSIAHENLMPKVESNTLQKFNLLLRILGKAELKTSVSTYQNANLIRVLRNMVVHPVPGRVMTFVQSDNFDYSSQQCIVKKSRSALGLNRTATFPKDIITKECAIWAVASCEAFLNSICRCVGYRHWVSHRLMP